MIALTHEPSPLISHCVQTFVPIVPIDYRLAVDQHRAYSKILEDCDCRLVSISSNREYPDGTFIEDTAVVLDEISILASMGTESRRLEPAGIEVELGKWREVVQINPPATLEGGDVLQVGKTLFVGLSSRTNREGIRALEDVVKRIGYQVRPVRLRGCLHLKTACTALNDACLLVNPEWVEVGDLGNFELVEVAETEPWAANVLRIGSRICMSAGNRRTEEMLCGKGFEIRSVALSEFAKAEGGVTCLSLVFRSE